jgi:hypothetical protein
MRRMLGFMMVCAMPTATWAAPADMFDLVCTGQQQLATGKPPVKWSERLRFDLSTRRWCRGACKTAAPVGNVTPDEITIYDSRATTGGPADVQLTLSRTDGSIREAVQAGWSGSSFGIAEGKCVREPYSGLPGQKF